MNKRPVIQLLKVHAGYDGKTVLRDVHLTIYENDFLGVIGPNGGGKTTLVRVILGLEKPTQGELFFYRDGKPVKNLRIGYLPQSGKIDRNFPISVYDTVLSGYKKESLFSNQKASHSAVQRILERMELSDLSSRPIGALSGGQLQRVLLSRALVSSPEVLILDEPDTYIDRKTKMGLYQLLEEVNKETAIVLVSHDLGAILQNVRSIACVDETLHYHPQAEIPEEWRDEETGCPIDLIGHGHHPHRILKHHATDE